MQEDLEKPMKIEESKVKKNNKKVGTLRKNEENGGTLCKSQGKVQENVEKTEELQE